MPKAAQCYLLKRTQLVAFSALAVGLSSLWQGEVKSFFSSRYSVGDMVAAVLVDSQLVRKVCQQHSLSYLFKPSPVLQTRGRLYMFTGVLNHLRQ